MTGDSCFEKAKKENERLKRKVNRLIRKVCLLEEQIKINKY